MKCEICHVNDAPSYERIFIFRNISTDEHRAYICDHCFEHYKIGPERKYACQHYGENGTPDRVCPNCYIDQQMAAGISSWRGRK